MRSLAFCFAALCLLAWSAPAAEPVARKQFIIMLKLNDRLAGAPESAWTPEDNAAVQAHFERLKKLTEAGEVIVAGRTLNEEATAFGIIVVEVADEKRAREIMTGDPAVQAGVMKAELFPFYTALLREKSNQGRRN